MFRIILLIIIFFLFSFLLTYLFRYLAIRYKIYDIPGERSLHQAPVPRSGGLAIVISWYVGITVLFFSGGIERGLYLALMSGIIIAVVSFIDDIIKLSPLIRLIFQFCTAIAAFFFLGKLRPLIMPEIEINYPLLIYPFAIIGMVWFINLFNFMDGVDGFASIEAIIVSLVMFFYSNNIINILLIACVAGFLFWNWPKARIFMGDIGSTQLGFILVILGIYFHNNYKFSIINWIMLTSPFWFDATLTLFRRWRNKEKLSQAHRKHVYQRFVQSGASHLKTDMYLVLINAVIILFILIYREFKVMQYIIPVITLLFLYSITRYVDKKVPFK
ncbi:MAG TPA: glycosyltransferase family 4 protein [Bacteroidales bacterium]|nr:glycosyltransferase family 4 protein [Bacteroidales bacterium]HOU95421.1 glycosyltransferase family 4 protein [Bacteroidales bacterium]HQG36300.1 glycosyltransferase family 4 protein [Bacteroidales bacterium]HQG52516.1 glycosyltransferase family 4 protein [Bacteroidales bacterium]HQJ20067.1 glycosyltransferase family 4 protein [Bacteroidales bacterium]